MKRYDAAALGRSELLESGNPGFMVLGGTHENKVVRWVSSVHRVARGSRGVMGEGLGKGLLLTTRSALP